MMSEKIIQIGYLGLIVFACAATVIGFMGGNPSLVAPLVGPFTVAILLAAAAATVYKTVLDPV